ncbi:putative enzyme related to lactoylglutathione lyase [Agrococcus jenensis]|uniref:Putative enzyme related to lactoylglutathione lyase n=2 Tax=Agrococcus jenensis TaxID=46353 RepID=A0A3N2ASX3_9MICO|nr:putative enzyme related to lactoylglutathione lyase [Agrococcus jenensis]
MAAMEYRIELIFVPVRDTDRAKAFYTEQLGWHADFDQVVRPGLRFVQITPPGSACSIAFGEGIAEDEPGTMRNVQVVIDDADATRAALLEAGVDASEVDEQDWGRFVTFADPDGNRWTLQQLPARE